MDGGKRGGGGGGEGLIRIIGLVRVGEGEGHVGGIMGGGGNRDR